MKSGQEGVFDLERILAKVWKKYGNSQRILHDNPFYEALCQLLIAGNRHEQIETERDRHRCRDSIVSRIDEFFLMFSQQLELRENDRAALFFYFGHYLLERKHHTEAGIYFERAMNLIDEPPVQWQIAVAKNLYARGRIEDARRICLDLCRAVDKANEAECFFLLGLIETGQNNPAEAAFNFMQALRASTGVCDVKKFARELVIARLMTGNLEEARNTLIWAPELTAEAITISALESLEKKGSTKWPENEFKNLFEELLVIARQLAENYRNNRKKYQERELEKRNISQNRMIIDNGDFFYAVSCENSTVNEVSETWFESYFDDSGSAADLLDDLLIPVHLAHVASSEEIAAKIYEYCVSSGIKSDFKKFFENLSGFSSLFDSDKVQIGMDEKKHLLIKPENLTEFSFPGRCPKILIFLIRFVQKIKLPSHALCGIGQKPLTGFRMIVLNLYARGSRNGQIFKMSRLLRLFQSFQGFYDMMCRCQNLNEMRDALLRMLNAKVVYINGGSHG